LLVPHGHVPPPIRIPWLAVLITIVLQQGIAFLWYAFLFGDMWVEAQAYTFDYRQAHEGVVTAPLIMLVGNALGAILLSVILQRVHFPVALGPLQRGLLWGFLIWLCIALPLEASRDAFALRDIRVLAIDSGEALVSWLIAGLMIGSWRMRGGKPKPDAA